MRRLAAVVVVIAVAPAGAAAIDDCRGLEFDDREAGKECFEALLADLEPAVRAEAAWALDEVAVASAGFRGAVAAEPKRADIRVRWGELFLEARNAVEAKALFDEALELDPQHVPAMVGLARVALGGFDARAEAIANEILEIEPGNHEARLILARLALEADDPARAEDELEGALAADDPRIRLEAFALRAAMDHLADRVPSPWEARAMALYPGYGTLYETIAYFYIITRRYREAITQLERAVTVDPELWTAYGTLGMNLLRVNRFDDAYRMLTRAHDGAPYNLEVVNALRLLDDVLAGWEPQASDGLVLRIDPEESVALSSYATDLTTRALAVVGERYAYRPDQPVVVELYGRHEDFAVRTAGVPGIGILGATFGEVVVMDGPSARGIEDGFDWASALWHEIAHVITLGATNNRVARWFSEGISVLEEWQTGPSRFRVAGHPPGRRAVPVTVIDAHREGKLLPVADLDEGFVRPRYSGQIGVSYTQAGLVCEYIALAHGREALVHLLAAFAAGLDTGVAVETALDLPPGDLDSAFAAYLDDRFAAIDTASFRTAAAQAHGAAEAGNWAAVVEAAERAIASYPFFVDQMSPYPILADAEDRLGRRDRAIAAARTYWQAGGRLTTPLSQLVRWLTEAGDLEEATVVKRALALVAPLNGDYRADLGDRLLAKGSAREALGEYLAYRSLHPHDQANAHYRLARAHFALAETEAARREVLLALEIAPTYTDALRLLLDISAAATELPDHQAN